MELTETSFRVRRASLDDAARIASVGAKLFAQALAAQNTIDNMVEYLARSFGEEQQRRELADPRNLMWLAEDENAGPIGYAHLKLDSPTPRLSTAKPAELSRIYADARWHGRGVGAELLRTCIDAATTAGAGALWLAVWKENPRGIAFYRKNGFRVVGEQTFHLGSDPQHDWVMVRDLDQRTAGSS